MKHFYFTSSYTSEYMPDYRGSIKGALKAAQKYANEYNCEVIVNDSATEDIVEFVYPDSWVFTEKE